MSESIQLAVIGAGPAGLATADEAARSGIEVLLIDDQQRVGGQIYRGITRPAPSAEKVLGTEYLHGKSLLVGLKRSSINHVPGATVWQVTPEREIYFTKEGVSRAVRAEAIVLATGALERPMPIPGWTLPGVMTAGAGQILLKTAGLIPAKEVVLAGSGPLLLLLAAQILRAGGSIGAIVETTPRANYVRALRHLPGAIRAYRYLQDGFKLLREISRHHVPCFNGATELKASGDQNGHHGDGHHVTSLHFMLKGQRHEIPCTTLLLHMGVVPNVQMTRSLDLQHVWDAPQRCWRPRLGRNGEADLEGFIIAGDGGGIGGAMAAEHQGRIAGLCVAQKLGAISSEQCNTKMEVERRALDRHTAIRPFLDALYAPSAEYLSPPDETIVCRCEEVTAGEVRAYVKLGCLGPNQTKSFGRPGMGPCQGRFCGLTVSEIIAEARDKPMEEIGYYRIRPPIKPVTLGELATLDSNDKLSY